MLLEISFCDTRVFWTNLVCSERCWVSIRKQVQITASWLEPFTLKPKRIFALTFWFSIKDGLRIFKQLINWSSWKKGHLQSHSSWCVSVNWEFRKGAINSSSSLRKHPFLLALRCWGRFARRNVCNSATEIPYCWHKICPESGQKRWLVDGVVTLF